MKFKWYALQTYSGKEHAVRETIEQKKKDLNWESYIGRVIVPEEIEVDLKSLDSKKGKYVVSSEAEVLVKNGNKVEVGSLLAREIPVCARESGVIRGIKNFYEILIETLDHKNRRLYSIPGNAKLEKGIKEGIKVRKGLFLTQDKSFPVIETGRILKIEKGKEVQVLRNNGRIDKYFIPQTVFNKEIVYPGMKVEKKQVLAEGREIVSKKEGIAEINDYGVGKDIMIRKIAYKKMFPGYVFLEVKMNDDVWHLIRSLPNVVNFISAGGEPLLVGNREIRAILRRTGYEKYPEAEIPKIKINLGLRKGEIVKIKNGPFEDFTGPIHEIDDEKQEVKVMVTIFGRETPVVLHASEVERID